MDSKASFCKDPANKALKEAVVVCHQEFRADFARKMHSHQLPAPLTELFLSYYDEVAAQTTGRIPEASITPASAADFLHLDALVDHAAAGSRLLDKVVCIRLNGGLGTSMGMTHAKSLLPARHDATFLDIIFRQAESLRKTTGGASPLLFMNSFATHDDTMNALMEMASPEAMPRAFIQHRFPKVSRPDLRPVTHTPNPAAEWNPPGHGDIYTALVLSGTLDALIAEGKRWALVANADNLGASLDPSIVGFMAAKDIPFLMECAVRTPADSKGGHLACNSHGQLILRELAQCPNDELPLFQDITRHGLFNTNNIWLDLEAIRERVKRHGLLRLPLILNPKRIDPRDPQSAKVWQIETAMGAAISLFSGATAIVVPRRRFLPVKRCNDLLLLWSDCFSLEADGCLKLCITEGASLPRIRLDPTHYGTWDRLMTHFPHGAPSLRNCTALRVEGNVLFGRHVTATGEVLIQNNGQRQAVVPDGTVLQGTIIL